MKKKGFTLVELLVVIAIIAMLLAILMPALSKVRAIAYRLMCGTNLGGLGKAMVTYANDYAESYPVLAGTAANNCYWGPQLTGPMAWDAAPATADPTKITQASITGSLFLLIKYVDVSSGSFVCKATDAKKFDITTNSADSAKQNYTAGGTTGITDVTQAWDFGRVLSLGTNGPWDYVSYSYQVPNRASVGGAGGPSYPITASSLAGQAVMADKSPWYSKGQVVVANDTIGPHLITTTDIGPPVLKDKLKLANSTNHAQDGQNVLYADSHTSFETTPMTGIQLDNIYTTWVNTTGTTPDIKQCGVKPTGYTLTSMAQEDSFLAQ